MGAFDNVEDESVVEVKVPPEIYEAVKEGQLTSVSMSLPPDEQRRLYEAMQAQGVPLVDNQTGRPIRDMLPQKRVPALSIRGDMVWRMCQYPLAYLIEFGDEAAQAKALDTRAYWQANQSWIIHWGNESLYFVLCERALNDLQGFKKAVRVLPSEGEGLDRIIQLALAFAEDMLKPQGLGFHQGKRKGKRKKH